MVNGISAECSAGENAPKSDELSTTETNLANTSQLVDNATETQDAGKEDDGPSLPPKILRMDDDCTVISTIDSGIGTGTDGSQYEGADYTNANPPRMSLDLTPPSEEIENEMSAEADEQSANRIQEMTNLSEKVKMNGEHPADFLFLQSLMRIRLQVHSWHQRLKPILLHSERRNDFDVRETSRNIVACFSNCDSSLQTKTQTDRLVSFENIMERRDKADTARYFFSMLQMVSWKFFLVLWTSIDRVSSRWGV